LLRAAAQNDYGDDILLQVRPMNAVLGIGHLLSL
jgi:hypothetical protein